MYALTDQEVRSCIQFSGMFGDKTYAQTAPIHELRKNIEWLRTHHPDNIPDHIQSKLNTRPIYDVYPSIICILIVCGLYVICWGFSFWFMYTLSHLT